MLCNNCLDYLPITRPPLCQLCGRTIKKQKSKVCAYCKRDTHIDHGRAWTMFIPPVDKIIHHFKYRKKTKLSILLGKAMANIIISDHFLKNADAIVPVPLFWWKNLRRGYNQAALLSEVISLECSIPVANIVKRVKNTKTQTKLNEAARKKNVLNAFRLNPNGIKGIKVILIDDVLTTGATMNECARILKQAGAEKVYSCVAAITRG